MTALLVGAVAAAQWAMSTSHFTGLRKWILANVAAFWVALTVAFPLKLRDVRFSATGIYLDELAFGLLFGLILGAGQWMVVRGWLRRPGWWILANCAGWGIGALFAQLIPGDWRLLGPGTASTVVQLSFPILFTAFAWMRLLAPSNGDVSAAP